MPYRTTAEWRERGFIIRTGERSRRRNSWGTCLFNSDQVRRIDNPRVVYVHHTYDFNDITEVHVHHNKPYRY